MMIAAPSHTTSGPPSIGQRLGDLGAAGEVLGQLVVVGDEAAEVDDALHARVLGRPRDVGGGAVVGVAEAGLPDAVDQVVDDVDGSGDAEGAGDRLRVAGVEA